MIIRRLLPPDAAAFQALRLVALRESPSAFSSSYEEECNTPLSAIERRLAPDAARHLFGAFDGNELLGILSAGRETQPKVLHKASIRAVYVAASHRGKGVARQLLEHALAFTDAMDGLRQVTLTVTAGNAAAIALYESLGFKAYGQEPQALCVDGVFYDDLLMVRPVGAR